MLLDHIEDLFQIILFLMDNRELDGVVGGGSWTRYEWRADEINTKTTCENRATCAGAKPQRFVAGQWYAQTELILKSR